MSSLLFHKRVPPHGKQNRLWKYRLLVRSRRKKNGKSNFSAGASRWVGQWTTCAATCKETQGGRSTTMLRSLARVHARIRSVRVYKWLHAQLPPRKKPRIVQVEPEETRGRHATARRNVDVCDRVQLHRTAKPRRAGRDVSAIRALRAEERDAIHRVPYSL